MYGPIQRLLLLSKIAFRYFGVPFSLSYVDFGSALGSTYFAVLWGCLGRGRWRLGLCMYIYIHGCVFAFLSFRLLR